MNEIFSPVTMPLLNIFKLFNEDVLIYVFSKLIWAEMQTVLFSDNKENKNH